MTTTIHASIDIEATPQTVYKSWSRFEEFPTFMEGVQTVSSYEHEGNTVTEWVLNIEGEPISFQAKTAELIADRRISWTTTTEHPTHSGVATIHRITDGVTRLIVEMDYEPEGIMQRIGDLIGVPGRLLERNLARFKRWVEEGHTLEAERAKGDPSAAAFAAGREPTGLI